jgi:iron complex outermembrane receptor protein
MARRIPDGCAWDGGAALTRALTLTAVLATAAGGAGAAQLSDNAVDDLGSMSLEQLANLQVTSVSKSAQPLRSAAATIYVITHSDIVRSGARSIADALRLAPNLQVTQLSASNYIISARGFGDNVDDQSFSNKLLMLIDGRSVYTPLFSGVYMDAQDVLLEDVDRIEVISGPGATLWGANAMNGVVNIITRSADATQGAYVSAGGGNEDKAGATRYGGQLNDETDYRVYGMAYQRGELQLLDGAGAHDGWSKGQGGFRLDWSNVGDTATLQGDVYRATENQLQQADLLVDGANLLGRWQHRFSAISELQVQAYYDLTERAAPAGGDAFVLHTYDLQVQQTTALGSANNLVLGAGERVNDYTITNGGGLLFVPPSRSLTLANVFAQDSLALLSSLSLVLGVKFEDDPFAGWSTLPDARLSWGLSDSAQLWAAGSRAVRSPTPFDVDVVEKLGSTVFLTGNPDFHTERLTAYELGYRAQPVPAVSFSVAAFYNHYDELRTVEFDSSTVALPLHWGNLMSGDTYGLDAWGSLQVTDWWRLSPGVSLLHKRLHFEPGASGLLGVAQAGDDPAAHGELSSSMDIGHDVSFDASVRYTGALPDPALPGYYNMTARVGWHVTRQLELTLSGTNLLHSRQLEYPAPDGEEVTRTVMAQAVWRH